MIFNVRTWSFSCVRIHTVCVCGGGGGGWGHTLNESAHLPFDSGKHDFWYNYCAPPDGVRTFALWISSRCCITTWATTSPLIRCLESIYVARTVQKTKNILADQQHPANQLFHLLPSGRRFRSIKTRTTRFRSSFYSQCSTRCFFLNTCLYCICF